MIKEEPESQDEDKNLSTVSSCDYNLSQFRSDESKFDDSTTDIKQEEEDSDEDMPLVGIYTKNNNNLMLKYSLFTFLRRNVKFKKSDTVIIIALFKG